MNEQSLGAAIRAVRLRRHLRQRDLADLAGVGHSTISLVERGHCRHLALETLTRIAAVVDIRIELVGRWRAGNLDRLLCSRHSMLAEDFARFLASQPAWIVEPEVSFSIYGERGVIDQLEWHASTAHLLIVELKTEFVDVTRCSGPPTASAAWRTRSLRSEAGGRVS